MTKLMIVLIFLAVSHGTIPQVRRIDLKGILTARNGDPIPGCNVVLKGETMASTTQACGQFEISIPADYSGVLVLTCLAPRTWEIQIKKLEDEEQPIMSLMDWDKFTNRPCDKNYKKVRRIKIR